LVCRVAQAVAAAAGSVMLIGDPAKYSALGYAICGDVFPGLGPLAGVHAALTVSGAEWNLVVACDMPDLEPPFLTELLKKAEESSADCVLCAGKSGRPEPLCAVYHRRALSAIEQALQSGVRKMMDGLAGLRVEVVTVSGPGPFRNINTPQDWLE